MNRFFKCLIIFCILAELFLITVTVLVAVPVAAKSPAAQEDPLTTALLLVLAHVVMDALMAGLLYYYGNVVTAVSFEGDNAVIQTNVKRYVLPSDRFTKVIVDPSVGRTFLLYDGCVHPEKGTAAPRRKKFVFQHWYSPFKSYSLHIEDMQRHMTNAVFIQE